MDSEEDVVELLARGTDETFGMRDWDHHRELLTLLVEEIRSMHSTLVAIHSEGKGFPVSSLPRPVTALDRIQRRAQRARHQERIRLVLPEHS